MINAFLRIASSSNSREDDYMPYFILRCDLLRCSKAAVIFALACLDFSDALAANLNWTRELSTMNTEDNPSIAVDTIGNVYISGSTEGGLFGSARGVANPFICKYDSDGTLQWGIQPIIKTQEGYDAIARSYAVVANVQGSIYISGYAWAAYTPNATNQTDVFLNKYDNSGNLIWGRRFDWSAADECFAASADALGNLLIAGKTRGNYTMPSYEGNAFVSSITPAGDLLWTREIATQKYEAAEGVASDGHGFTYVVGTTYGDLIGPQYNRELPNPFLTKVDSEGNILWTRQIRSFSVGGAHGVTVDKEGNILITGGGGNSDQQQLGFVGKFDSNGNELWLETINPSITNQCFDITTDPYGNALVVGATYGPFTTEASFHHAFLAKFDPTGETLWIEQLGNSTDIHGLGVAATNNGRLHITGTAMGGLQNLSNSGSDIFLAQYIEIPEPPTMTLAILSLGISTLACLRHRWTD